MQDQIADTTQLVSELSERRAKDAEREARMVTLAAAEHEVSDRLRQRTAELDVINAVQLALAAQLDMQGIVDVVGEKIREIFAAQDIYIALIDNATETIHFPYYVFHGQRVSGISQPLGTGLTSHVIASRQLLVINEDAVRRSEELGAILVADDDVARSWVGAPMIVGNEVIGVISLQDQEREHAYPESAVTLLSTLAASAGVALDNARLFAETKRLLTETDQRAAELDVINAVQRALAAQLDMQEIVDIVGNRILEIFSAHTVYIALHNRTTNMISFPYYRHNDVQIVVEPRPLGEGLTSLVIQSGQPLVLGTLQEQYALGAVIDDAQCHFYLGVPMMSGDDTTGMVSVQNFQEHAFDDADVALLSTLAASMGVALENARLFAETRRLLTETDQRAAELALINSVQQALAAQLDMQAIVDVVGEKIREIFDVRDGFIALFDLGAGTVDFPYYLFHGRRIFTDSRPIGVGLTAHVLKTRQPLVINEDVVRRAEELGAVFVADDDDAKSWIGMPMIVGDKVIGMVSLQDADREDAYGESEVNFLATLAASMGVALENARLFADTRRLLAETDRRAAELAIINSVQQALAEQLDMQGIVHIVGEKIREIFNAQVIYIALVDRNTTMFRLPYYRDGDEVHSSGPHPLGAGLTSIVIQSRCPLVLGTEKEMVERGGILDGVSSQSYLGVPLISGDTAVGAVSVQSYEEHAYSDADVNLLQTLAAATSVALENARLFTETTRLLAETDRRAAELALINSVQQALAADLDMQGIVDTVGEKIREIFDVRDGFIALCDHASGTMDFPYYLYRGRRIFIDSRPLGEGLTGHVLNTRQPLVINEDTTRRQLEIGAKFADDDDIDRSWIGVPMIVGDEVIGVISLHDKEREHAYPEPVVTLLSTLTASAGAALQNARLFAETRRLLTETNQRAAELGTVNAVSQALASELDLDALIELTGEQIRHTFEADIVYIALLDRQTNMINFPYTYGEDLSTMAFGEGLASRIIATREPLLINEDLAGRHAALEIRPVGVQAKSYLGVPIIAGDDVIGVLSAQSTRLEGRFDEHHLSLLSTIAANVGVVFENARLFQAAQDAQASAELSNTAKSTFLANMSHELRTPLNAIIGFTRIVRRHALTSLPEKQVENLDRVLVSADHLLGLINTVLDIAKIEAGKMDVQSSTFGLPSLMDLCLSTTQPLLRPGVVLEKVIEPNLPPIHTDQEKVRQIIVNLLSNAAKFTGSGRIVAGVQRELDTVVVTVTDTGIGISAEALGRIFEEFQQADTSTTRKYGGTGLGLSISRHLARLLGGELRATSAAEVGSTFTLVLPLRYEEPITAGKTSRPAIANPEAEIFPAGQSVVLAIDDDPDAIYLLEENLAETGYRVVGLRDSRQAVARAKALRPFTIALDVVMPDKDGWQVLYDLKQDPDTRDIPVILLTIVDKKAFGYQLGAADYLVKPFDREALLAALDRVSQGSGDAGDRLLVVDDDPDVVEMVRQLLADSTFDVVAAADGVAALAEIAERPPAVVLLDLMLPRLDGFAVIEELRRLPSGREIPIVVLTAKDLSNDEVGRLRESVSQVIQKQGLDAQALIRELYKAMPRPPAGVAHAGDLT